MIGETQAANDLLPKSIRGQFWCAAASKSDAGAMAFVISSGFIGTRSGAVQSRCSRRTRAATARRALVSQLQAEPQPGEPGYKPPVTQTAPTSELVKKGVVKSPFKDVPERREEDDDDDVPEAAKPPIRAPMAAIGRPKVVPKRAKTKQEEDEEQRQRTAQARSFAEARTGATQQQEQQPVATAAAPKAEKRPGSTLARRSILDTGNVPKFPGLPPYLQPLPEDTREQREKLRARIPVNRK